MYYYNLAITLVSRLTGATICKVPVSNYAAMSESNARGEPHTVMGLVSLHTQDLLRV